jgi:hypothetical protein
MVLLTQTDDFEIHSREFVIQKLKHQNIVLPAIFAQAIHLEFYAVCIVSVSQEFYKCQILVKSILVKFCDGPPYTVLVAV